MRLGSRLVDERDTGKIMDDHENTGWRPTPSAKSIPLIMVPVMAQARLSTVGQRQGPPAG